MEAVGMGRGAPANQAPPLPHPTTQSRPSSTRPLACVGVCVCACRVRVQGARREKACVCACRLLLRVCVATATRSVRVYV